MRLVLFILFALVLGSCSTLKKSKNNSSKHNEVFTDTSVTHITELSEQADSNITLPGDTTAGDFNLDDTCEQVIETPTLLIKTKVNKKKGKLKTTVVKKPVKVPVKINKKAKNTYRASKYTESKSEEQTTTKDKEKVSWGIPWYVWLILVVIGVLFVWWKL